MIPPCIHRRKSAEAYTVPATNDAGRLPKPTTVMLCNWPEKNIYALYSKPPRWLERLVGSGLAIIPEHDCVGCPAVESPPLVKDVGP